jgi:hypothetical protein
MAEPATTTGTPAAQPAPIVRSTGTAPTAPTNQADLSPQERWQATQDERARSDPWLDMTKILAKDERGNLAQYERVVGANGEVTKGKRIDPEGAPNGGAPPVEVPAGELFKFGDLELSETQIRDLVAEKAANDLRKAQVPATPREYKLELPKDMKLPEGAEFKLAAANDPVKGPAIQAVQDWAHKNNLSQAQFGELLGLYAASQSREQIMIQKAALAERDKLGLNGPQRVDAIALFLKGRYGDTAARPMLNTLLTESQVKIWEDVVTRLTNQGSGSFRQTGRDPEPNKLSDAAYDALSYTQKKEYAEQATARTGNGRR